MASKRSKIANSATLATADDLDGTTDNTQLLDISGAAGTIIIQHNNGTAGTAGVDVIEISRDGGTNFVAATAAGIGRGHAGLLTGAGAVVANAALNAAGVEPVNMAVFSLGPVDGKATIRCGRKTTTTTGTTWVTGAPSVTAHRIG